MPTVLPYVPQYITVHLGAPSEEAQNVTVSFPDYIKNVASSEIYPTWNEQAIYANIYAQISFALNRIYTEFYRSQGYNFDITNNTAYDQKFINGRNIFENISRIVDDIFDSYIRVAGQVEPLAAKYCNGTTVTCQGLSQWGSQRLAEEGLDYFSILQEYYGNNIEIVTDVPIRGFVESYPGTPIRRGDTGNNIQIIQVMLNRISNDYPAIPKIYPVDGIFGENTENSVIEFQRVFNLTPDGIVGRGTWYRMVYLYTGLTRLSELYSEGQNYYGIELNFDDTIFFGNTGTRVQVLQYMLSIFSQFDNEIPPVVQDGVFGSATRSAVEAFQSKYGLPVTGVVNQQTWDLMYRLLKNTYDIVIFNVKDTNITTESYPGTVLQLGSSGDTVRTLQEYINAISAVNPRIEPVTVTGVYGRATRNSVLELQELYGILRTGNVNEATWDAIANGYRNAVSSQNAGETQHPGNVLREGDTD